MNDIKVKKSPSYILSDEIIRVLKSKKKRDPRKDILLAGTNFLQLTHYSTNELSFSKKAESSDSTFLLEIKVKFKISKN